MLYACVLPPDFLGWTPSYQGFDDMPSSCRWNAEAKYNQAFLVATDERLCLNCSSVVADAKAVPAAATLDNNYLLFCR